MTTTTQPRVLTNKQIEQYEEQGYFVVRDLYSRDEVAEMLAECESILRGEYGELFQGAASMDPGSTEDIKAERKISAVVERSTVFRQHLLKDGFVSRLQDVLGPDILLYRDILMLKPAQVGSKMPWHQDSNYWGIEPAALCSVWTALDPATLENGCMRVIPGSHKLNLIQSRSASGTGPLQDDQIDLAQAIDLPMEPGSSLFFHSKLLHGSEANHSNQPRRAFIASFMSAQSRRVGEKGRSRYFKVSGTTYPGCVQN
jgi:ectoine hydroxylase-related dioxygenase (phytanoyl-CoA dioxygenase family)